jgi:uncharacterized protein (TIGR02996 family)
MAVYFVYRSHYEGPSGKHVRRFDDCTVLDWFRNHWDDLRADAKGAAGRVEALLGCRVYGFSSLFESAAEHNLPAPATTDDLEAYLNEHLYVEGELYFRPHSIEVLTDDDEIQLAYYIFDDDFLARQRRKAAYLLHDGWRLPGRHGAGGFTPRERTTALRPAARGEGTTYLAFLAYYDSLNLDDIECASRIKGVRVPDLARYLVRAQPREWPFELRLLRSQLLAVPAEAGATERGFLSELETSPDDAPWLVYSDWLADQGRPPAGLVLLERALRAASHYPVAKVCNRLPTTGAGEGTPLEAREELAALAARLGRPGAQGPARSLLHVEDHLAQLCLHTDRWGNRDLFHQWVFFDDCWASAHPDLARGVLCYAARWDVL